jgi:phage gp16-like protein
MDEIARKQIARIKMLQRELGMPDERYRAMLASIEPVNSSKDLTPSGRAKALRQLTQLRDTASGAPPISDNPQIRKLYAQLTARGVGWAYLLSKGRTGRSMLMRLTGKQRLEFCTAQELGKVIAALEYDQKRRTTA